tara:strand:+ start:2248 stop:3225 length:978 start_codon:yes stop_codon:yes gene_type:complete
MSSQNILVTGAAGFIGSHLCDLLVKRNNEIVGIDNFFRGNLKNLFFSQQQPNFHFYNLDLTKNESIKSLKEIINKFNIEKIFHLAAINGTHYFYDSSFKVLNDNILMSQNIIEAIKNTKVNYVIYTSSSEAYGDPLEIPTSEKHPIILNSYSNRDSYAVSKIVGDYYFRLFAENQNIKFLSCRVFNQYGPRMIGSKYGQVIGEFIQRIINGEKFTIIGDGSHSRSFCYVKDGAKILTQLADKEAVGFINIGNDEEITIMSIAQLIHKKMKQKFNPTCLKEREHDHKRRRPDLSEMKKFLKNFKYTSLDDGIDLTISYFLDENKQN